MHAQHTATLLPNGQVLVAGGADDTGCYLASAELSDPATGIWTATGSMTTTRGAAHGDVAIEWAGAGGGRKQLLTQLSKCGTIRSGDWGVDRHRQHGQCTRRSHGDVAIEWAGAGGRWRQAIVIDLASAELYDPATGMWTATGSMATARWVTRRRCCRMGR